MSREEIRQAVTNRIETIRKTLPLPYTLQVVYENSAPIDMNTWKNPYLEVEVKFVEGEQADLSDNPFHRIYGVINLIGVAKEFTGTAEVNRLLDMIYPQLHGMVFDNVHTHFASFDESKPDKGKYKVPVIVPFWCNQLSFKKV